MRDHRQALDDLSGHQSTLTQLKQDLIADMQSSCEHPHNEVVEGKCRPGNHLRLTLPPFRVCRRCGYAEEGWGCGYWLMTYPEAVPEMDRESAKKLVRRIVTQSDMDSLGRYGKRGGL